MPVRVTIVAYLPSKKSLETDVCCDMIKFFLKVILLPSATFFTLLVAIFSILQLLLIINITDLYLLFFAKYIKTKFRRVVFFTLSASKCYYIKTKKNLQHLNDELHL